MNGKPYLQPTMSTLYIVGPDGQQTACEESQVRQLLRFGGLTPETLYWRDGMAEWRPLSELPAPPAAPPPSSRNDEEDDMRPQYRIMPRVRLLRLAATVMDFLLFLAPFVAAFFLEPLQVQPTTGIDPIGALLVLAMFRMIITQLLFAFSGRSLGKNTFSLRAVDESSHAKCGSGRYLVRLATHGSFFLVPLAICTHLTPAFTIAVTIYVLIDGMAIFYDDRCLHDYMAGTTIVQREFY